MAQLIQRAGKWYSDLRIGGRRVRRALSPDKREAEELLGDLIKERNATRTGRPTKDVAWKWWQDYYLRWAETNKDKVTVRHERRGMEWAHRVRPIARLRQMTPELLDAIKGEWQKRGRPIPIINRQIRALKVVMRKAEEWKYATPQDWTTVRRVKGESRGRVHFWTTEQLAVLLTKCQGVWRTVALLGARAGMRREEMYWLEWRDVDFKHNRVHVVGKEGWEPKGATEDDPKSRWMPMPVDLRAHLAALYKRKHGRWVLDAGDGRRPTIGSMTVYFKRVIRKAKLKGSLHTLRHTYGAHLAMGGMSLRKIADLMGHSTTETTEIYAHLSPETRNDALKILDA